MNSIIVNNQIIKIGDTVKIISDENLYSKKGVKIPTIGQIYKIRSFTKANGIHLVEIINDKFITNLGICEPGFAIWRFEIPKITIDEILDKINLYGVKSLFAEEILILEKH